ncbi:MAG TPA: sterol desaturase family protein [Acidimicrobiales bacterium]|nr:sterol desaturase family protein [Acidimicrobiales bacterium]
MHQSLKERVITSGVIVSTSRSPEPSVTPGIRFRSRSPRRPLSSRVYLPALSIVAVAVILVAIGWSSRWGGVSFASSITNLRVVIVGPVTLALLSVFLVVERIRPAQRRTFFARGYRQDLLYTVLNATLVVPLVVALSLSFAEVARRSLPWVTLPRVGFFPRWGVIMVIFVAMDGCNWFAHYANHRVRVLWRFHELHHSQEDMSVLTVFRTHPLIHVSYLITLIPGIVLIANGAIPTTLLVVYAGFVAFEHSNTNLSFGPLGRIFVSPNYHRIHHRFEGRQDVNLGFALSIWDQLSHRAIFPTRETIRIDTGLPNRPLIVEQASPRPHHFSVFFAQLVAPFRPIKRPGKHDAHDAHDAIDGRARAMASAEPGPFKTRQIDPPLEASPKQVAH